MSDRLLKESDVLRIAFQLPLVVNSAFADAVKALPSADRPKGELIFDPEILCSDIGVYSAGYRCSVCGKDYFKVEGMNYCPNCGCRMKGADDE